jgi:phosphoribosylpyrophosphate synthetase
MPIIDLDMIFLGASYFLDKIKQKEISSKKVVVVAPDCNGVTRAKKFKDVLELNGVNVSFGFIATNIKADSE